MSDSIPGASICRGCGRPVTVPTKTASTPAKPPRHIGIPGEPVECPK